MVGCEPTDSNQSASSFSYYFCYNQIAEMTKKKKKRIPINPWNSTRRIQKKLVLDNNQPEAPISMDAIKK